MNDFDKLVDKIMKEFANDGEPVTREEAEEIARLEIKAKANDNTAVLFCKREYFIHTLFLAVYGIYHSLAVVYAQSCLHSLGIGAVKL